MNAQDYESFNPVLLVEDAIRGGGGAGGVVEDQTMSRYIAMNYSWVT
jgi:hypothetical protein